jgi:hypothetical protein
MIKVDDLRGNFHTFEIILPWDTISLRTMYMTEGGKDKSVGGGGRIQ